MLIFIIIWTTINFYCQNNSLSNVLTNYLVGVAVSRNSENSSTKQKAEGVMQKVSIETKVKSDQRKQQKCENTSNYEESIEDSKAKSSDEVPFIDRHMSEYSSELYDPIMHPYNDACDDELIIDEVEKANTPREINNSEITGQRSEITGQRSEITGQRSEITGQISEITGQRSEITGQRSEITGQRSEITGQVIHDISEYKAFTSQKSAHLGTTSRNPSESSVTDVKRFVVNKPKRSPAIMDSSDASQDLGKKHRKLTQDEATINHNVTRTNKADSRRKLVDGAMEQVLPPGEHPVRPAVENRLKPGINSNGNRVKLTKEVHSQVHHGKAGKPDVFISREFVEEENKPLSRPISAVSITLSVHSILLSHREHPQSKATPADSPDSIGRSTYREYPPSRPSSSVYMDSNFLHPQGPRIGPSRNASPIETQRSTRSSRLSSALFSNRSYSRELAVPSTGIVTAYVHDD